jgi:hypothetical protein
MSGKLSVDVLLSSPEILFFIPGISYHTFFGCCKRELKRDAGVHKSAASLYLLRAPGIDPANTQILFMALFCIIPGFHGYVLAMFTEGACFETAA